MDGVPQVRALAGGPRAVDAAAAGGRARPPATLGSTHSSCALLRVLPAEWKAEGAPAGRAANLYGRKGGLHAELLA